MRFLRVVAWWLFDLAVVAAAIACILHVSRRRSVSCDWHGMRATCVVETEDSLGRVQRRTIEGIHGAAYRNGRYVGLVTDARHKDVEALFGTAEIEAPTEAEAERLRAFADDHEPDHYGLRAGVAHPRLVTAAFLLGLIVFGFFTGRMRRMTDRKKAGDV
jgi:hypothetical protein